MSSSSETRVNTNNMLVLDHSQEKIFLGNNRYMNGLFDEPSSGDEYTLEAGTVVGRIASTGKLKIFSSTSTDGSQIPVGIVQNDYTMASGETGVTISICITGQVDEDLVLLSGSETMDTVVTIMDGQGTPAETTNKRIVRDMIQSLGIELIAGDELTKHDNS